MNSKLKGEQKRISYFYYTRNQCDLTNAKRKA